MLGVSYYRRCTCTCRYCGAGPSWAHTWPALVPYWALPGPAMAPPWARPGCWPNLGPPWSHPGPSWPALPGTTLGQTWPSLGAGPSRACPESGKKCWLWMGHPTGGSVDYFLKKNLQKNLQIFAKNGLIFGSIRVLEPPGGRPIQGHL